MSENMEIESVGNHEKPFENPVEKIDLEKYETELTWIKEEELEKEAEDSWGYDKLPDNKKVDYRIYVMWEPRELARLEIKLEEIWWFDKLSIEEKSKLDLLREEYMKSEKYNAIYEDEEDEDEEDEDEDLDDKYPDDEIEDIRKKENYDKLNEIWIWKNITITLKDNIKKEWILKIINPEVIFLEWEEYWIYLRDIINIENNETGKKKEINKEEIDILKKNFISDIEKDIREKFPEIIFEKFNSPNFRVHIEVDLNSDSEDLHPLQKLVNRVITPLYYNGFSIVEIDWILKIQWLIIWENFNKKEFINNVINRAKEYVPYIKSINEYNKNSSNIIKSLDEFKKVEKIIELSDKFSNIKILLLLSNKIIWSIIKMDWKNNFNIDIKKYLDILENYNVNNDIDIIDTIMQYYYITGNLYKAKKFAKEYLKYSNWNKNEKALDILNK